MENATEGVIETLLGLDEPSVILRVRRDVLGESNSSLVELQERVRSSPRASALLAGVSPGNVYNKWHGAHWVLADLADLGYPPSTPELIRLRKRVLDEWLDRAYYVDYEATTIAGSYRSMGVPVVEGRHRRCASQQGNALRSIVRLGLADGRASDLVERLLHWQWPDGGWNCDRNPAADSSSFMETLLPMRGLVAYAEWQKDETAAAAARRAAEVFLERELFRRRRDGRPIDARFLKLHFPLYWHYDFLGGLKAMAEMGLLDDPRCATALELLESKRLQDGGWPAETKLYRTSDELRSGATAVDWGGTSRNRMNPWVTVEALTVLRKAGCL